MASSKENKKSKSRTSPKGVGKTKSKSSKPVDYVTKYLIRSLHKSNLDFKELAFLHCCASYPTEQVEALLSRDANPHRIAGIDDIKRLLGEGEDEIERLWNAYVQSEADKRVMREEKAMQNEGYLGPTLSNSHTDVDEVEIEYAVDTESSTQIQTLLKDEDKS